jgi:hypothetical protein
MKCRVCGYEYTGRCGLLGGKVIPFTVSDDSSTAPVWCPLNEEGK